MAVRLALPTDAVLMAAIEHEIAPTPWSLSQFLSSCRADGHRCWVSSAAGAKVTGFAVSQQIVDEVTLLNLGVASAWQGKGVGTELLQTVVEHARACAAARCLLEVRASNDSARSLYRKAGFCEDGIRKDYYPAPAGREDGVLMSLDLTLCS